MKMRVGPIARFPPPIKPVEGVREQPLPRREAIHHAVSGVAQQLVQVGDLLLRALPRHVLHQLDQPRSSFCRQADNDGRGLGAKGPG